MTIYTRPKPSEALAVRIARLETDASFARRRGEWRKALALEREALALERDLHEAMRPGRCETQ